MKRSASIGRSRTDCAPIGVRTLATLALLSCLAGTAAADEIARARMNFIHHCAGCHLVDGSGAPSKGIPSMRGTLGQFLKVPGGREFIVQVPGVMNSPLGDGEIASLMNWLLPYVASATTPANTPPYTADEIARLRKHRPLDVITTRRQLIAGLHQAGITIDADPAR